MDFTRFDEVIRALNENMTGYGRAQNLADWNHRIDNIDEPSDALYNGESEVIQPGLSWSSAQGKAWFWKKFTVPAEVNGVKTEGSPVDFSFIMPIGATIYLDNKQIYHEPFWADTRAIDLRLFDECKPGEEHLLTVKAKSGDGFGLFLETVLRVKSLADMVFELETFREQLKFCRYLFEKGKAPKELESVLDEAVKEIDIEALKANNWDAWKKSASAATQKLMPFDKYAKEHEVTCVAHSHIDMNWLWPWTETVEVCRRDFTSMDSLMDRFPTFHFSQSQVSVYAAMEKYHPDVYARMKERVKEGRWEVTASTWVEGDLNTALGETLVRQILHSKRYMRKNFGIDTKICWEPDTFGHPATLPQILKKSGIEYYYFMRAGKGHPMFWWEAPDGSRIQAYNDFYGYGGFNNPTAIVDSCRPLGEHLNLKIGVNVYGVGDHGGAATARDVSQAEILNDTPLMPKVKMGGITEFHKTVADAGVEYPVVQDELNTIFEGCYSSHGDIKWLNRYGESSLLSAETMAAVAALDAGRDYPTDGLADAWKNQSFHQFHDILCGCSIGSTYVEAAETLKPSHDFLRSTIAESAKTVAAKVNTGDSGKVVVFNQLAWERTDVAEIPVDELPAEFKSAAALSVKDEAGNVSPAQILDGKLIFVAKNLPALGCKAYSVSTDAAETTIKANGNTVENEFFRLRVNTASGAIDSLYMKDTDRDLMGPRPGWGPEGNASAGKLNRFMIYMEQPHPMSAWNIGDITEVKSLISGAEVKLVESGPVCAAIEVKHKFMNSGLAQQVRVYAGLNRIDFVTEVDWHEKGGADHDAPMLKATFTPYLGASKATYEIPYAAIERVADGREVPALRWADISDDKCGITLLNNCKYGHTAQGNTLTLTLVRASYEPDNNPDERVNKFTYSIVPHAGDWKAAKAMNRGVELNQPLTAVFEAAHGGSINPGEAYLSVDASTIVVSAVKLAEDQPSDSTALVVRLFESVGEPTKAKLALKWPVVKAEEVNMLEETEKALSASGNEISLDFGKHEIKTVKVYVGR